IRVSEEDHQFDNLTGTLEGVIFDVESIIGEVGSTATGPNEFS
ncbi:41337_t:CDS:1, partial [Gigaspora margarita]